MTKYRLLASAPTLSKITMAVEKFYAGTPMRVVNNTIIRKSDNQVLQGVRVVEWFKKGKLYGYRFECEE